MAGPIFLYSLRSFTKRGVTLQGRKEVEQNNLKEGRMLEKNLREVEDFH